MGVAIRPTVVPVAVPIALVQPTLVIPLQLVVEGDAFAGATVADLPGLAKIGAVDLGVVLDLAVLHKAGVELLARAAMAVRPVSVQKIAAALRQDDVIPVTGWPLNPNELLLPKVSEVA